MILPVAAPGVGHVSRRGSIRPLKKSSSAAIIGLPPTANSKFVSGGAALLCCVGGGGSTAKSLEKEIRGLIGGGAPQKPAAWWSLNMLMHAIGKGEMGGVYESGRRGMVLRAFGVASTTLGVIGWSIYIWEEKVGLRKGRESGMVCDYGHACHDVSCMY